MTTTIKTMRPGTGAALTRATLCVVLLACACRTGDADERGAHRVVPSVEAVQARHGSLPLSQRLSGVVRARNQIGVYPEITAIISEVLVDDGDAVRSGDVLARLRDAEFRQRLRQAKANLEIAQAQLRRSVAQAKEARADYERAVTLSNKGLASQAELDAAEARAESADAEVELAHARVEQSRATVEEQEHNLAQTVLRAPIAGRLGSRDADVGMLASPSTRLFTLGQLDSVRVEIVLTDRMLGYIEVGQRAEVSTMGGVMPAHVSRISPFLNPVSHSTEAELDLANPDALLKPGMFVTVDVYHGESEQATLVPVSALYENPSTGAAGVYVTRAVLERASTDELGRPQSTPLTDPVSFAFVPVEVIAQGRMETAVRGIERDTWVVTLGQNLLGGESAEARVRPVTWERVVRLQRLRRDDMMRELIKPELRGDST
jgi:RND family efflux transporter MFP subunit